MTRTLPSGIALPADITPYLAGCMVDLDGEVTKLAARMEAAALSPAVHRKQAEDAERSGLRWLADFNRLTADEYERGFRYAACCLMYRSARGAGQGTRAMLIHDYRELLP